MRPMPQNSQPMGLRGRRVAMTAPATAKARMLSGNAAVRCRLTCSAADAPEA